MTLENLLDSIFKLTPIVMLGIYLGRLEKRLEAVEKDLAKKQSRS